MAIKKRSYVTVQVYRGVTFEVSRDGRGCWHYRFPDHPDYSRGSAESASNARIYARAEIEFKQDRAELQRIDAQPIVPEGYEPAHDTTACKGDADCPYRCPPRVYLVCVDSSPRGMSYDDAFNLVRFTDERAITCETEAEAGFWIALGGAIIEFYGVEWHQ